MAEFRVDSWNKVQLGRLRDFFHNQAKAGDSVIFDRRLAETNALSYEGLDDEGCNSWVYRVANQALEGLSGDEIRTLADTIKLTTAYLHSQYPEEARHTTKPPAAEDEQEAASEWDDEGDDLDLNVLERPVTKSATATSKGTDAEAKEWAKVVKRFKNREHTPV